MKSMIAAILTGGLTLATLSAISTSRSVWSVWMILSAMPAIFVYRKLSKVEAAGAEKKALRSFDKAIESGLHRAAAYYERGEYHLKRHSVGEAIKDFTEAIRFGDSEHEYVFYLKRGTAYRISQLYDEAIADFSRCVESNPGCEDAYLERGKIYAEQKKDYDAAIKDFNRSIELNPLNALAKYQLEKIEESKRWTAKSKSAAGYPQAAAAEDVWDGSILSGYYESSDASYDSEYSEISSDSGYSDASYDSGYSGTSYDSGSSDASSGSSD